MQDSRSTARRAARTAIVALALAAAGCGNSGEGAAGPSPRQPGKGSPVPTRARFTAATEVICDRTDKAVGAYIPLGSDPATRRANRQAVIGIIRKQMRDIEALGYPRGSRSDLEPFYRAMNAAVDRLAGDDSLDIEEEMGKAFGPHARDANRWAPGCA
jgi:hypothetical protein